MTDDGTPERTTPRSVRARLQEVFAQLLSLPALVSIVVLLSMIFVYVYAAGGDSLVKGHGIGTVEYARGLITLLFSVGTIVIALILTLFAIFQTDPDAKERFARGKEILTLLIGIFGTIVGFYFGSLNNQAERQGQGVGKGENQAGTPDTPSVTNPPAPISTTILPVDR